MNQKKIGFTLVEVIIIIAVVSIGIMTVIVALNNGNKYLQKSREKIIAINLARE
jgi:Tfp pilus assembly protein PilE